MSESRVIPAAEPVDAGQVERELKAMRMIVDALAPLSLPGQTRVIDAVKILFQLND